MRLVITRGFGKSFRDRLSVTNVTRWQPVTVQSVSLMGRYRHKPHGGPSHRVVHLLSIFSYPGELRGPAIARSGRCWRKGPPLSVALEAAGLLFHAGGAGLTRTFCFYRVRLSRRPAQGHSQPIHTAAAALHVAVNAFIAPKHFILRAANR